MGVRWSYSSRIRVLQVGDEFTVRDQRDSQRYGTNRVVKKIRPTTTLYFETVHHILAPLDVIKIPTRRKEQSFLYFSSTVFFYLIFSNPDLFPEIEW